MAFTVAGVLAVLTWRPAFSADSAAAASSVRGGLVFTSTRTGIGQVYAYDVGARSLSQLTFPYVPMTAFSPSVSGVWAAPNGRLLLVHDQGNAVISAAGARTQLPYLLRPAEAPWSPDSRSLLGSSGASSCSPLMVAAADGSSSRELASGDAGSPAWSLDGSRVAFLRTDGCENAVLRPDAQWTLAVIDAAGSSVRELGSVAGGAGTPAWSPDGRRLAVVRGEAGAGAVWLVSLADGRWRRLSAAGAAGPLRWSRDGRWLAYLRTGRVELVRPDGSGRRSAGRAVMPAAVSAGSVLAWSANGLLAVGDRDGLRVYDPAAHRLRVLDSQPVAVPAWSPDSSALAYEATPTHSLRLADLQARPRTLHRFAATSTLGSLQWLPRPFPRGKPPEPVSLLVREHSDGLALRATVSELSVRGTEVAFLACGNVVGIWNPTQRTVAYPLPEWTRPPLTPYACVDPRWQSSRTSQIGLSTLGLAYWRSAGGNQRFWKFLVGPPPSGGGLLPWPGQGLIWWSTTTGGPPRAGWTHSDRDLLIVSTREVSFAAGTVTVASQTLWRIEPEGYPGSCPIFDYISAWHTQPGRCKQLAAAPGQLLPLDVDAGRIAVLRADGSFAVLDGSDGHTITATPALEPPAVDARLSSSDLVVLRRGSLDHYNAATGALLHSWALPDIAAGRRCDIEEYGCPPGNRLTLEDTARGVVAYILDGRLHLLRLADGHDLDLAAAALARFTAAGLVYATSQQGDWTSRLTFVSDRELSSDLGGIVG